jgi:hypothetical protein
MAEGMLGNTKDELWYGTLIFLLNFPSDQLSYESMGLVRIHGAENYRLKLLENDDIVSRSRVI